MQTYDEAIRIRLTKCLPMGEGQKSFLALTLKIEDGEHRGQELDATCPPWSSWMFADLQNAASIGDPVVVMIRYRRDGEGTIMMDERRKTPRRNVTMMDGLTEPGADEDTHAGHTAPAAAKPGEAAPSPAPGGAAPAGPVRGDGGRDRRAKSVAAATSLLASGAIQPAQYAKAALAMAVWIETGSMADLQVLQDAVTPVAS